MAKNITFEHPLNERTRLLLRLAHLFDQLSAFQPREEQVDSRVAVNILLQISSILSRSDIKSEVIKELERHMTNLVRISQHSDVDMSRLDSVVSQLENNLSGLHNISCQLGQELRDHELLKSITQRTSIPGGSCDFDMPVYNLWLQQSAQVRCKQLKEWMAPLEPLQNSAALLIDLIRTSSRPVKEVAEQGFFPQSLDRKTPVQMLRVTIPVKLGLIAEVSGGKHRFSVRFLKVDSFKDRPTQTTESVPFELTKCVF
ncbi:cell division protein ZapD [Solemya velum gill symbiont]|uniref:cell division protein ZapD n=1 Tax=Solemya velum gill symbiont TaxID=2340 RepID=UPI0009970F4D|nr:cell division protein ZapD [Solemya velum gill symbiont]OOZ47333.1 hypothetical protein BOW38_03215 [Solemya velum gill symbiont]OOZ49748.1 hypothetical protein BOW39_04975 [Solemya velum gill symbiont]OOZ52435.1 hypothetical protein BOW40_02540 [Solemya velum gill symbiont]OOZ55358.1 hypothetical protein BOW41_03340 [Solemya velum gill symbiont]OOZ56952.1 hypothetical protein BOW42_04920 [Solemya velum gill symbiont]